MRKALILTLFLFLCGPVFGVNDYTRAVGLEALYTFESYSGGADSPLDTSGNGNTLTPTESGGDPSSDAVNFKEGLLAASNAQTATVKFARADGSLQADYPGRNGTTNRTFSIALWARPTALDTSYVAGKWSSADNTRSFLLGMTGSRWQLLIGYNGGTSTETFTASTLTLGTDRWYFLCTTYDGTSKAKRIWIWDEDAESTTNTTTGGTETMNIEGADFTVMNQTDSADSFQGQVDEVSVWSRVLTLPEIIDLKNGVFAPSSIGQFMMISKDYWKNFFQDGIDGKWRIAA